ncbi:hypothetical protein ES703_44363 [subsurface metagenome]
MTLEELEKRVKVLEDIEAIKQLHINYVYLLCNLQWEDMLECFAEDATLELLDQGVCKGKKEISGIFYNVLAKMIKRTDGHFVGQPIISVKGDRAKGHWILYLFFAEPEVKWLQGRQDCEYVRVGGEWKFSSVKFTAPWPGA